MRPYIEKKFQPWTYGMYGNRGLFWDHLVISFAKKDSGVNLQTFLVLVESIFDFDIKKECEMKLVQQPKAVENLGF
jgi:hypothetical protein